MNANEVIANRASELRGGKRGDKSVHPTTMSIVVSRATTSFQQPFISRPWMELCTSCSGAQGSARGLAQEGTGVRSYFKIGRTHLQDATPIRLGQEFSGYASQVSMPSPDWSGSRSTLVNWHWEALPWERVLTRIANLRVAPLSQSAKKLDSNFAKRPSF